MKKILFVKDLKLREEIETLFYVKYFSLMEARDGRKYISMILTDSTGDLESRIWSNTEEYSLHLSPGHFVKARGKLNLYQGRKQFIIQEIEKIKNDQVNEDDFIYKSARPPEEMYQQLLKIVENANDYYIKTLLLSILQDPSISKKLKICPAGKSIHHAYRSGLLEHILSCAELAQFLSPRYRANFNYVLAGCILHDLCKIYELSEGFPVEYTEEGKLVGHLVRGLELIDRFAQSLEGFPYSMKLHLKHILLSHHGEYQFGSPKLPQTSEAMLVHLIDLMDSKMNALETIKRTDSQENDWSVYVKHLDRMVYKLPLPQFTESIPPKKDKQHSPPPFKQGLGNHLKDFKVITGPAS